MGDAAAVTDNKETGISGLQFLIDFYFHVVEFDFHTVEQSIIIGGAGCNLIQCVDHLDDAVQNSLGKNQTQIAGRRLQGGGNEGFLHAVGGFWSAHTLEETEEEYDIPNTYLLEDKAFIESIESGIKDKNNIDNVLESAKLLDLLYLSADKKKEVYSL